MRNWPPQLQEFRREIGRSVDDTSDDLLLSSALDAAVAFVERVHRGKFAFADYPFSPLPPVPDDMWLGTLRLARRLHNRRQSPDGLVDMGELGSARIPSFDPDIDRALRIGRYRSPVFG